MCSTRGFWCADSRPLGLRGGSPQSCFARVNELRRQVRQLERVRASTRSELPILPTPNSDVCTNLPTPNSEVWMCSTRGFWCVVKLCEGMAV